MSLEWPPSSISPRSSGRAPVVPIRQNALTGGFAHGSLRSPFACSRPRCARSRYLADRRSAPPRSIPSRISLRSILAMRSRVAPLPVRVPRGLAALGLAMRRPGIEPESDVPARYAARAASDRAQFPSLAFVARVFLSTRSLTLAVLRSVARHRSALTAHFVRRSRSRDLAPLGLAMRRPGIEPGLLAWEANVLPLDQRRSPHPTRRRHFNVASPTDPRKRPPVQKPAQHASLLVASGRTTSR